MVTYRGEGTLEGAHGRAGSTDDHHIVDLDQGRPGAAEVPPQTGSGRDRDLCYVREVQFW